MILWYYNDHYFVTAIGYCVSDDYKHHVIKVVEH